MSWNKKLSRKLFLQYADVGGVRAFDVLYEVETDTLVLHQRRQDIALDFRTVGEQILTARLPHDEDVTLVQAESLYDARFSGLSVIWKECPFKWKVKGKDLNDIAPKRRKEQDRGT